MAEALDNLGEEFGRVDGLGPGKWRVKSSECRVEGCVVADLNADARDLGVEGFDADA